MLVLSHYVSMQVLRVHMCACRIHIGIFILKECSHIVGHNIVCCCHTFGHIYITN